MSDTVTKSETNQTSPDSRRNRALTVGSEAEKTANAVKNAAPTQDEQDRSWIARTIIWIFVGAVSVVGFLLVLRGAFTGDWAAVTTMAVELLKSAVIPIVTLMLGYYFGQSSRP